MMCTQPHMIASPFKRKYVRFIFVCVYVCSQSYCDCLNFGLLGRQPSSAVLKKTRFDRAKHTYTHTQSHIKQQDPYSMSFDTRIVRRRTHLSLNRTYYTYYTYGSSCSTSAPLGATPEFTSEHICMLCYAGCL